MAIIREKLAGFFGVIKNTLGFIQNHFKAMIFLLIVCLLLSAGGNGEDNSNLVRIDLKGSILESDAMLSAINKASDNPKIKGVLFVVDSSGGEVTSSLEISMAIKRLSEKKPVVAYAAGMMVSGSYYASIGANYIIANPGSMVGSIGVIMQTPNIEELSKKVGISQQVVKAGKYKEAGTFSRTWTQEERDTMQEMVDEMYEIFVDDIVKARGLDKAKAGEFADARVFIAAKAQRLGLIDAVGSIEDAKTELLKLSNVQNPVWKEPDFIDKIGKKLAVQMSGEIASMLFGTKVYW